MGVGGLLCRLKNCLHFTSPLKVKTNKSEIQFISYIKSIACRYYTKNDRFPDSVPHKHADSVSAGPKQPFYYITHFMMSLGRCI